MSLISMKLNISNMMNGLKNFFAGLILQNMLYAPIRSLLISPSISSSVLIFALLRNQRRPIFSLNIFVRSFTPSSKSTSEVLIK